MGYFFCHVMAGDGYERIDRTVSAGTGGTGD